MEDASWNPSDDSEGNDSLSMESVSSADLKRRNSTANNNNNNNNNNHSNKSNNRKNNNNNNNESLQDQIKIAKGETNAVFRLRLLVFGVLFASAVAVSSTVFFITTSAMNAEYKAQYEAGAKLATDAFVDVAQSKLTTISSIGVAMIAHGIDHALGWPLVTLSSFQQRSKTALMQSAIYIGTAHYLEHDQVPAWNEYAQTDSVWIQNAFDYQENAGVLSFLDGTGIEPITSKTIHEHVYNIDSEGNSVPVTQDSDRPHLSAWLYSPVFDGGAMVSRNYQDIHAGEGIRVAQDSAAVVISEFITAPPGSLDSEHPWTQFFAWGLSVREGIMMHYTGKPISRVAVPVFNNFDPDTRKPAAFIMAYVDWSFFFRNVMPDTMQGLTLVLSDSCGGVFTFRVYGSDVVFMGEGDQHETAYDDMRETATLQSVSNVADGTKHGIPLHKQYCPTILEIYPSSEFESEFTDNTPVVITVSIAGIFIFTVILFLFYDVLVERRQALVMREAALSQAIVSSLFPENVRNRLMNSKGTEAGSNLSTSFRLKSFLKGSDDGDNQDEEHPIADLFPHCTVFFADIAGFTAWSSTRDPSQVFILLQTLYGAFDKIANRRQVFKVETIGDSYLAVTGLPEPQKHHAVIMARFASDCISRMKELTTDMESSLGPDTADLSLRVGLHSGPVTAGVLRGDRARFQLFGDTVNTASRMESTGVKGMVQCSQETADLLQAAGKGHWISARTEQIVAKGKGTMQTYFVTLQSGLASSTVATSITGSMRSELSTDEPEVSTGLSPKDLLKKDRLVNWMVDLLKDTIKKIVAMRGKKTSTYVPTYTPSATDSCLDEISEVIVLPEFDAMTAKAIKNYRSVDLSEEVISELREFVDIIALTYKDNPFHNFEHACHVTMSTQKFLKRIFDPEIDLDNARDMTEAAWKVHRITYGINSDPLTVLAILLSGLIHDADHQGISNMQLAKENPKLARCYKNRSIAEQNSLDISWELLMSPQFTNLQQCLFANESDLKRFRQVLVNVVLATDIFDKETNALRKERWTKAFSEGNYLNRKQVQDLRRTIVLEHIIQASDVSHTMQHWHVYRKWNQRLFEEMYVAFRQGRMGKDPSEFWYEGEIGFFDNYVIPLAKKLEGCNVFGVSSDECLNYAAKNRAEWEDRGQQIVAELVEVCQVKFKDL